MNAVTDFLAKHPVQYLATVGLDGRPKVRPFQFMLEEGGKLFFCTSNRKEVYREIQRNPYVEICVLGDGNAWLRLSGNAVFSNDLSVKSRILETSPLVKSIYKTPENPVFEIFHLADARATVSDFSGNPPKTYDL